MKFWHFLTIFVAGLTLAIIAGCGGGGGPSSSPGETAIFLTDDLATGYDHVWIQLYEIEAEFASGSQVIFDSSEGKVIDVRALNSAGNNLFQFLGVVDAPSQPIVNFKFTVDTDLSLMATGATTATTAVFVPGLSVGGGKSRFEIAVPGGINLSAADSVTFDFDLAQWNLSGGQVTPVGVIFNGPSVNNLDNQRGEDVKGTVSGLTGTAPDRSFVLTTPRGTIAVVTNANTAIFNSNGAPSPVLANGETVEVRGKFDPVAGTFVASSVKIEDGPGVSQEPKVKGPVQNVNSSTGTFEVRADFVRNFVPTNLYVPVTTSASTRFYNRFGVVISSGTFFDSIAGSQVEVEGAYNGTTLAATKVKLEDGNDDFYPEARGPAMSIDANAGQVVITVQEWEGFAGAAGQSLTIASNGSTQYRNEDGDNVTKQAFFAALAQGNTVKGEGTFEGSVLVAKRMEIRASGGGGGAGNDPHDANGTVSNINAGARTYTVTLTSWVGFNGAFGTQIQVTMNSNATYRDDEGNSLTEGQFFAGLQNGGLVEVDGLVTGTSMAGVKAKLDDD